MKYPPSCAAIDAPHVSTDRHPFPSSPSDYFLNFLLIPNFLRPVRKADSDRPHSPRILLSRKFPHFRAAAPQSSPTLHQAMQGLRRHEHRARAREKESSTFCIAASLLEDRAFSLSAMQEKVWREQSWSQRVGARFSTWTFFFFFPPPLALLLISSRLFFRID